MPSQLHKPSRRERIRVFREKLQVCIAWRCRVPQRIQMSTVECGSACLAMILSYYGRQTSVAEINEHCGGVGRDGLSALHLIRAARAYGLRARAVSLQKSDFRFLRLPAIVHWEFQHFLVLEHWSAKTVQVVDPAAGRLRLSAEEFDRGFTGIVLLFEPGNAFLRRRSLPQTGLRAYVLHYLKTAPWLFVQVLLASLLLQLLGLGIPLLTKVVVDHVTLFHPFSAFMLLGAGILILLLSQLVTTALRAILLLYLQARVDLSLMLSFFEHLLDLPLHFFQQRASGDILARLGSNTVIRDTLSNQLISTVLDGSFVIMYLAILFWQSSVFGFLVLSLGLLQVLLLLGTNRPLHELSMRELMAQGKSQGYVNESLVGIVSLKAAGAEQRTFQHWCNLFCEQLNVSLRRNAFSAWIETITTLLRMASPLVFLWVGALQVLDGKMQVGTMLALNALAIAFLAPLASLISSGQRLQLVRSHLERLADVMEAEPEQDLLKVTPPPRLTGRVALEGVSFRYGQQSPNVLNNISLRIEPGQKVAIVGRTGSGKSTLGKLLLGLYLPTEGSILYDEMPLSTLNYQAVRAQFGVVMQEATPLSGTIRQNIAFTHPEMELDGVVQAAKLAALHDDVLSMPMGYETFISEQGSALSGGQRQRLVLARALAHTPVLLLLDEATSALDVVTEQVIERNLAYLACTQIIIAHRLSTIRHADCILVLDEGTIIERGTHQELWQRNGYYAELVRSQYASEEAAERSGEVETG